MFQVRSIFDVADNTGARRAATIAEEWTPIATILDH